MNPPSRLPRQTSEMTLPVMESSRARESSGCDPARAETSALMRRKRESVFRPTRSAPASSSLSALAA
jgi:hypothetical protein